MSQLSTRREQAPLKFRTPNVGVLPAANSVGFRIPKGEGAPRHHKPRVQARGAFGVHGYRLARGAQVNLWPVASRIRYSFGRRHVAARYLCRSDDDNVRALARLVARAIQSCDVRDQRVRARACAGARQRRRPRNDHRRARAFGARQRRQCRIACPVTRAGSFAGARARAAVVDAREF